VPQRGGGEDGGGVGAACVHGVPDVG
jgi:hypothetical protein